MKFVPKAIVSSCCYLEVFWLHLMCLYSEQIFHCSWLIWHRLNQFLACYGLWTHSSCLNRFWMWTGCWRSLHLMVWTHLETLKVILWSAHSMIILRKWHVLSSIHVSPFWCLVVEISQSSCLITARHQWRRHSGPLLWVLCGDYRLRMTLVLNNNAFWCWCRLYD